MQKDIAFIAASANTYAKPRKNTVAGEKTRCTSQLLKLEYLDEESGEALCPLCGDFAYPISQLKNLHDHRIRISHSQRAR